MIASRWTVSYRYDRPALQKASGFARTNFDIVFTSWDGGAFVGTVVDDLHTGGTPGRGEVIGTLSGNRIAFVKRMPVFAYFGHDRLEVKPGKRHRDIYYTGTVSAEGRSMSGQWRMKLGFGLVGFQPAIFFPSSGTWEMTAGMGE